MPAKKLDLPKVGLEGNALDIFERRYALRGRDGKPKETVEEAFYRVAGHVAGAEKNPKLQEHYADRFYSLMAEKRFIPNTPTWTGSKTKLGQLAACFVLPIEDDMGGESRAGIFQTLKDAALIQKSGGGNGFSFSGLRPKGDIVKSSNGLASGPVSFMEIYDAAFGNIAQGGTRRGANMAVLRVDHPDIYEFIRCKAEEGRIANFNISVGVTDAFMQAVKGGKTFDLINPRNGKVWTKISASSLFDEIVKYAHHNGEPGVLFLDTANRQNPVPEQYALEATNPCITGDTLIYTEKGLRCVDELAASGEPLRVVVDGRFASPTLMSASPVFKTGIKDIYRLVTREGYELRLTADHRVMTTRGWMRAVDLQEGERVCILNRRGAFGENGTLEEGRVLGWLVGDGTISAIRAVLSFFGDEKRELAPVFAQAVTQLVEGEGQQRAYPVGVVEIAQRDEARVTSERLLQWVAQFGLTKNKFQVPADVCAGSEEIQRGFLQALFTADGQVNDGGEKGCSVRLSSSHLKLLRDVQLLLLNFGIASRIYQERRRAGYREMPDGKGGKKNYFHQAQHDLAISKVNIISFANDIGFLTEAKQTKLAHYVNRMSRGPYSEEFLTTVVSVEFDGREPVYDLKQPETRSFIANGIVVHNCGEQWLGPYENCCLGHVNINAAVRNGRIDWDYLLESVVLSVRFLDDVITQNAYVPTVPELKEAALKNRRVGLGFLGLADAMYQLKIRYGSSSSFDFASQISEFIRYHSMEASVNLAKEKGPFPGILESIYNPDNLSWEVPTPLVEQKLDWGRPKLDWSRIGKRLKKYGIRNATQMTVAPTGTTATVLGVEGYGCEPVFALAYYRNVYQSAGGEENLRLTYVSPLFAEALEKVDLSAKDKKTIISTALEKGSIQHLQNIPRQIKNTFVVSSDIKPEEHVWMQAVIQRFVDNSISKTCNFPPDATVEDVKKAYFLAWELGCKGLTVYIAGSRQEAVLETKETVEAKSGLQLNFGLGEKRPRPAVVVGRTHRIATPFGTAFVTVNRNGESGHKPFEVFVTIGKSGSDTSALSEALGRLISGWLRSSPAPNKALGEIVDQLHGIGGSTSIGFGAQRVSSIPDAVAKVLLRELELSEEMGKLSEVKLLEASEEPSVGKSAASSRVFRNASVCPECHNMSLVEIEGCQKCCSCSYTRC